METCRESKSSSYIIPSCFKVSSSIKKSNKYSCIEFGLVLLQYTATTNGSKCLILHSIGHNCTLDDLKRGTPSMLKLNLI